jgi:EmrB/QacA subfamily drug resistance transporter
MYEKDETTSVVVEEDVAEQDEFPILPRRQLILTMAGVMLTMFLASLDQTVVSTALPTIDKDLGGDYTQYTWVVTAYLVASATVIPIVGKLTDIYGRKWFYMGGIVIFLIGSALCGLSQNMTQLIVFRAIQGLGAGVLMANAIIVVGDLFPPAERGKYIGLVTSVIGLSAVLGPLLGGFITDNYSWHWVFYVNIPFGILSVIFFILYFPNVRPTARGQRVNYWCIAILVLAVVSLLLAFSWGGSEYPWASSQVIGTLVFGVVMTGIFLLIESRMADPFIPLELFKNRIVTVSMIAIFLTGFGMFGGIVFIPLFFQDVLGSSATASGTFLMPMMLALMVSSIVAGQVLSRMGGHYRILGLVGLAIMAVGMFLLSQMTENSTYGQAVFYIVIMGLGLGATMPIFTIAVQNAVPYRIMGVATSSTQFIRSIGGTMGLAVLGSVMSNRYVAEWDSTIPPSVEEALGSSPFSWLADNPQALIDSDIQLKLQEQDAGLFQQLMEVLKHSLSSAIGEVFLIGLVVIIAAFAATIFLREIKLKTWKKPNVKITLPVE